MKKRGAIANSDIEKENKQLRKDRAVLFGIVAISVAFNICLAWWAGHSIVGG